MGGGILRGGGWLAKGGGNSILARGRRWCELCHRRLLNEQNACRFAARWRGGRSEEGIDHGRTGIWRRRTRSDGAEHCAEHRAERVLGGGVQPDVGEDRRLHERAGE